MKEGEANRREQDWEGETYKKADHTKGKRVGGGGSFSLKN